MPPPHLEGGSEYDVGIVGAGPAGIAAAHAIGKADSETGVVCIDMGPPPEERFCKVLDNFGCLQRDRCHIMVGFGGSSLLSGGKVSSLPAGSSLIDITGDEELVRIKMKESLDWFRRYLKLDPPEISESEIERAGERFQSEGLEFQYYDSHIMAGSEEEIVEGYGEMLRDLKSNGMNMKFNSMVESISEASDGRFLLDVLSTENGDHSESYLCKSVVLGLGLPGKEFLQSIRPNWGIETAESKLEVGIRLEFPSSMYPDIDAAHKDLKLHLGDCRTFCVCKGGKLAPYFHDGISTLDGHVDQHNNTNLTNFGLRVRYPPNEGNGEIYEAIRRNLLEKNHGIPMRQMLTDFLDVELKDDQERTPIESSIRYWDWGEIGSLFPPGVEEDVRSNTMKFVSKLIPQSVWDSISVYGPGLYYPGQTFDVNADFSIMDNIYVIGECTGQFRGILQSFCSGLICGQTISGTLYDR